MKNCWHVLGIGPTNDLKLIKLAYAERVKTVHPEDDPEGFKELQVAYKEALQLAKLRADRFAETWNASGNQSRVQHNSSDFASLSDEPAQGEAGTALSDLDAQDGQLDFSALRDEATDLSDSYQPKGTKDGRLEQVDFTSLRAQDQEITGTEEEESQGDKPDFSSLGHQTRFDQEERQENWSQSQNPEFDFTNMDEDLEDQDSELYAGLPLQEFLQVTEGYLDWLEEQWRANPTYQQFLSHLILDDFRRYVIYRPFREELTNRLKDFTFKGPASERAIVFDFLEQYGLTTLLVQLKLNLHRRLHEEYSTSLSQEEVADDSFLSKMLAELSLVSSFNDLLAFVQTDQFTYCSHLEKFRTALTRHLKNYYFYGEWQVRSKLLEVLRERSMNELANFIAGIGLKDPGQQTGQATKGYER